MKFELIAQMINGGRETLSQAEFIGESIDTLADAVEAAADAYEYVNATDLRAEYIDVYCDECATHKGYCGYYDGSWHRDCDCDL